MREIPERKSSANQAVRQTGALGDAQALIVQICTPPSTGGKQFVTARVVDYSMGEYALLGERD